MDVDVAIAHVREQLDALALRDAVGITLTLVGQVLAGAGVRAQLAGAPVTLTGYDHFASPVS